MAKQDVHVELFYDGAWQDITTDDDVFADTPITILRGQPSESPAPRPSSVTLRLANDDDRYRTSNPMSPLYGKVGRNTPTRIRVKDAVRATAEASKFSADQSREFRRTPRRGKAWVDLEAGGLLRRVNGWTDNVPSPFYQYNADLPNLLGYWPHEDPKGAARLFTPVAGATSGRLQGAEFGGDRFFGSNPLANFKNNAGSTSSGLFVPTGGGDTDGWQVSFTIKPGSLGTAGDFYGFFSFECRDGTAYSLVFVDGTDVLLLVDTGPDLGTSLINLSTDISGNGTNWNLWQCFIVQATYSAGTTTIQIYYNTQGSDSFVGWSDTFSGNTSQPHDWNAQFGGAKNEVGFGHVVGMTGISPNFFSVERRDAFQGHDGETAADRFDRLCTLKNLEFSIVGTAADSMPMGPQAPGPFGDQLKEIQTTEDGLIFDAVDDVELVLVLRGARYNQTPALELLPADLDALPREDVGDLGAHNVVTAAQRDGGQVTATDETSAMGTQAPPDGVGEERQTVDVNLSDPDDMLPQVANWWLRRGTVALPRFPQVVINLAALDADRIAEVEAVDVGDVITIADVREYLIRLQVIGYTEVITTHGRRISFNCVPDQQFVVGEYDADRRYDLATCTLDGAHAAGVTSLLFAIVDDEQWGTSTPYVLDVAGEQVTVTSMGARSGSGPYAQTATVQRSTNGIVKTLPAGSPVRIATPGRWAL